MARPECLRDNGAVVVWDGHYLPGLWLVHQALGMAFERIATHGVVTFAMRRSHHIACLATLVKQATDRGYIAILTTSDPAFGFVAPYGGREPLLTPNPFAIGYPGTRTPVLVDICASITTVSMTRQKAASARYSSIHGCSTLRGGRAGPARARADRTAWQSLAAGRARVRSQRVWSRADGRSAHPRPVRPRSKDTEKRWGGNVFLQVLDPDAFAGREAFLAQMDYLTERCQANAPLREGVPVRMPGEQAERSIAAAREQGVPLAEHNVQRLGELAERFGLVMPAAL